MIHASTLPLPAEQNIPRFSLSPRPRIIQSLVLLGFSPYMLAFARRAKSAGVRIHLIDVVTSPREFLRCSDTLEPDGIVLQWSSIGTSQSLDTIQNYLDQVNADAVLTTDDFLLTWLGENRSRFEPRCKLLAPDFASLRRLWDKVYQVRQAAEAGFDVLPSWILTSDRIVESIPEEAFPVVIRPSFPNSANPNFKALVIASRKELAKVYSSTEWSHEPIVQSFCLGPNYVLHGVRSESGEMLALRLFKAYRKYSGFTVSMELAPMPADLDRRARRFVEAVGLKGAFHFELLRPEDSDLYYYLEINCRLGGTTGKAVHLGYDEPGLLFEAFGVATPRPLPALKARRRTTSLSLNVKQALNELRNRRDPLAYPRLSRFSSFASAIGESLMVPDAMLTLRDMRGTLWYVSPRAR